MVNKLVTTAGMYAAKKIGSKTFDKAIETVSNPYRKGKQAVFGIKPLNVGEREVIRCLQNPQNTIQHCKSVGDSVRRAYHKTGKYK